MSSFQKKIGLIAVLAFALAGLLFFRPSRTTPPADSPTVMVVESEQEIIEREAAAKKHHEAHKHQPYHDLETGFKVFAPRHMGANNRDPIILFPVKHGYLIVAHWEY